MDVKIVRDLKGVPEKNLCKKNICKTYYKMKNQSISFKQLQLFQFQLSFPKYVPFKPKNAGILEIKVK